MKHHSKDILIYGKHPVSLAIQNPRRKIKEIYATRQALNEIELPKGMMAKPADNRLLESMVGREAVHQGIVAVCEALPNPDLNQILYDLQDADRAMMVVLDQVSDPRNIGAILRSAVAFGASAVIIPQDGSPQETGTIAKSASGALDLIPLVRVANLARTLDTLKKADFWCVGLDGYAHDMIGKSKLPKRCVLVMGAEDGMRDLTKKSCDMLVKLPMNPAIESLNVSIATAVAMYEWMR